MFDTILIAKSQLENLINEHSIDLPLNQDYYDFQTKDLDNSLTTFFIRADGVFGWEDCKYEWIDGDKNDKFPNNLPRQEKTGEPEFIQDNRPAYIEFYDFYATDEDRIFVTFVAHVNNGKLVEPIKLKSLEKTNLEQEAIDLKKSREEWDKVKSTWEWRLATFLFDSRYRVKRFFYPLTKSLDKLDSYLRDRAKTYVNK